MPAALVLGLIMHILSERRPAIYTVCGIEWVCSGMVAGSCHLHTLKLTANTSKKLATYTQGWNQLDLTTTNNCGRNEKRSKATH